MTITPDISYAERNIKASRPSWSRNRGYVNALHRTIYAETRDLQGWQEEGDTYKLFEMGYFAGDVILEIGTYAGRSAVVELRGALSREQPDPSPQYFGVDIDLGSIITTHNTLTRFGLDPFAVLFPGDVERFLGVLPVSPTMVFVDGDHSYEGCRKDLEVLSRFLSPGTPVLCHDWTNVANETGEYGVTRACDEWQQEGFAQFMGVFGCSALYVTTERCSRPRMSISAEQFRTIHKAFQDELVDACRRQGVPVTT